MHDGASSLVYRFLAERHRHIQYVRRPEEAVGVVLEAKDRGALICTIGADALEDSHAVVEGMCQYMYFGFSPRNKLAIQPDHPVPIFHTNYAHSALLSMCCL